MQPGPRLPLNVWRAVPADSGNQLSKYRVGCFRCLQAVSKSDQVLFNNIEAVILGLQVYKYYLLWALKYIDMTYFGLFGAPGLWYCP